MTKALFTDDRLFSYVENEGIKGMLNGYHLVTFTNFRNGKSDGSLTRTVCEWTAICNLGKDYCDFTSRSLVMDPHFDALIAISPSGSVDGFIITELGECAKKRHIYAVNLICTQNRFKSLLLLGAYLYCIKQLDPSQQEAILELANHYKNPPGFLAYTKMGFTKQMNLMGPTCFWDLESLNLPMSVEHLYAISADRIIQLVTGEHKLDETTVDDPSHFYEKYSTKQTIHSEDIVEQTKKFRKEWCKVVNNERSHPDAMKKYQSPSQQLNVEKFVRSECGITSYKF